MNIEENEGRKQCQLYTVWVSNHLKGVVGMNINQVLTECLVNNQKGVGQDMNKGCIKMDILCTLPLYPK